MKKPNDYFVYFLQVMTFPIVFTCFLLLTGCSPTAPQQEEAEPVSNLQPEEEVFYLIFPRSFRDSDGDEIGDLKGVTQKLDYLQKLGVTSIIMTPLYPSIYYHNYFTHDFKGIDEEFGTKEDYFNMVREIHRKGMKFYMDTEVQYATIEHPWFKDSYKNPDSPYDDYIFYRDTLNTEPASIIFGLKGLKSYDGSYLDIATVNLYHPEVRQYIQKLYTYWVDPNKDGNFEDGVDGFRLDHTMDNLDNKNLLTNILKDFWNPLISDMKNINPELKFIAEQSDWDQSGWEDPAYGFFEQAGIDIVYSFSHFYSLTEKEKMEKAITENARRTPEEHYFLLFLDLHDTDRFASHANWSIEWNKQKAAMVYLSKGIPFIYYGQELGMKGTKLPAHIETGLGHFMTDGIFPEGRPSNGPKILTGKVWRPGTKMFNLIGITGIMIPTMEYQ